MVVKNAALSVLIGGQKKKRSHAKTIVQCFSSLFYKPLKIARRVTAYRTAFMEANPDLVARVEKEKAEHIRIGSNYTDPLAQIKFVALVTELAFAEATSEQVTQSEDLMNSQYEVVPSPLSDTADSVDVHASTSGTSTPLIASSRPSTPLPCIPTAAADVAF
jgi:hypothetical protein